MAPETAGAQPSPVHREAGSAGSQGAGRTVDAHRAQRASGASRRPARDGTPQCFFKGNS